MAVDAAHELGEEAALRLGQAKALDVLAQAVAGELGDHLLRVALGKLNLVQRLDRMARIDRNVLRLAVFELKWRPDIPKKVTLNEAVELGRAFGSEASSAFVNGLLDRIAMDVEQQR